jgi:hypothetical protein
MAKRRVTDPELGSLTYDPDSSKWGGQFECPPGNRVALVLGNEDDDDIAKLLKPAKRFVLLLKLREAELRRLVAKGAIRDELTYANLSDEDPELEGCDYGNEDAVFGGLSLHTVRWHCACPDPKIEVFIDYGLQLEGETGFVERCLTAMFTKEGKFKGALLERW